MKLVIRYFFKLVHAVVGPLLLLVDRLTAPAPLQRSVAEQQAIDAHTRNLVLYQYLMCPFCVSVRRTIRRLSLNIETRDVLRDMDSRAQLMEGGGQLQVPCLRISNEHGETTWLYESQAIADYLQARYALATRQGRA